VTAPYYQDEHVTLYHGDCLEVTEWLGADVLITDPPYGTRYTSPENPGGGYSRRQNHHTAHDKKTGFIIAGDDNTESRDMVLIRWGIRPCLMFASPRTGPPPIKWEHRYVWDKTVPGMGGKIRYQHEDIYVTRDWGKVGAGFSIIRAYPHGDSGHVHEKPASLMAALIAAAPAGTIADPFAGSGTTLVAAKLLGRRAVGVELEERYCEVAANRLSQGVLAL
jgi:DNA modification methylase